RSTLMSQIIENMVEVMKGGIHGTTDSNTSNNNINNSSNNNSSSSSNSNNTEKGENEKAEAQLQYPPSKAERPLSALLDETWKDIFPSGIISHKALATFRDLLRLGGARWFVSDLVK
ncbi:unnamed protein product, partial [Meganyctiphanes norvegica]